MSVTPHNQSRFPHYENPPVAEVVMGVSFAPFLGTWRAPHLGLFWDRIRDDFPRCEHVPPLGDAPPAAPGWPLPLPRTWFISGDESVLIQLQNGRFLLNWRRREGQQYPRYSQIKPWFEARLVQFRAFATQEGLGDVSVRECELTYINHVPHGGFVGSEGELGKILRDVSWKGDEDRFLPSPKETALKWRFDLPHSRGILELDVKHALRQPGNTPLYLVELTARGSGQAIEGDVMQWFDLGHEWIVKGFADLTTERAQVELWRRIDE